MLKVMLVDDDKLFCQGFQRALNWQKYGYRIIGALYNGNEVLEICSRQKPDILIMDIRMPGINGLELTMELTKRYPDIKIIILSAYSEFEYARSAIRYGASEYLLKTEVEYEDILQVMERLKTQIIQHKHGEGNERANENEKLSGIQRVYSSLGANVAELRKMLEQSEVKFDVDKTVMISYIGGIAGFEVQENLENEMNNHGRFKIKVFCLEGNVVCFLSASQEISREAKDFIESNRIIMNCLFRHNFSIGLSSLCEKTADTEDIIQRIIENVESVELILFYNLQNEVVYWDDIRHKKGELCTLLNTNEFIKCINICNWNEIRKIVSGTIETIEKNHCHSIEEVSEALKWYLDTLVNLVKGCSMGWKVPEELHVQIQNFCNTGTFEQMKVYFFEALNDIIEQISKDMGYSELIKKVLIYINENIDKHITLESTARYVYVNPVYLSALFKREVRKSFNMYVTCHKLEIASQKLMQTDLKVSEIARQLGYDNESYFTKIFKKIIGESPIRYRMNYKKKLFR